MKGRQLSGEDTEGHRLTMAATGAPGFAEAHAAFELDGRDEGAGLGGVEVVIIADI